MAEEKSTSEEDAAAEKFITVVTWALERILNVEYQEILDAEGNLVSLELSTKALPLEQVKEFFRRILSSEQVESLFSLKERHGPQDTERVLHLLFTDEIASQWAQELAEADWPDIARVVDAELTWKAKNAEKIGNKIIKEREGFGTPFGADVESFLEKSAPEALPLWTAEKYTREFLRLFPRMVRRAESLRILSATKDIPPKLTQYLTEASRCYIYGHFLASLGLCRSAIEVGVEARLRDISQGDTVNAIREEKLKAMLELAKGKLLDQPRYEKADGIRRLANAALHGERMPHDAECKDALVHTRGILEHLYE